MATLDTNVYQMPSFSKQAFELQQERKKERDTEVSATRAEDVYMQSKHLLQGDFARDASTAFGAFQEAGVKYKKSGSESDRLAMKDAAAQLNLVIGAAKTQMKIAGDAMSSAIQNQFEGYAIGKEQIEKSYADYMNRSWETKMDNGVLMVKEGETFVPLNQSSIYSSTPNPNNTYIIPKAVKQGKYVLTESLLNDYKDVSGASTQEKLDKIYSAVDYRVNSNDLAFISDMVMHYEIKELGHYKDGYSAQDRRDAEKRYQEDPEYAKSVIDSYKKDIEAKSGMYLKGAKEGYGDSPFAYTVNDTPVAFIPLKKKTNGIVALGQDSEGNYYKVTEIQGMMNYTKADESEVRIVEATVGEMPQLFKQSEQTQEQPEEQTQEEPQQTKEEPVVDIPEPEAQQETKDGGFGPLQLNLPSMNPQTGRAAPASEARALPDYYYENLIEFEGGVSTDKDDRAYALNPDAPLVNGKRAHTNRGVQYGMFKNWAAKNNIPESDYKNRFLNLSEMDAIKIVDDLTSEAGLMNLKDPVLRSLFAQNLWGTGKVWAADFKKGRSAEYRSILDWLQSETGLDFANTAKMSKEEAEAIQKLYDKDPEKFINQFVDKKLTYFGTLDEYDKFGKGWERRAEDLRTKALAAA